MPRPAPRVAPATSATRPVSRLAADIFFILFFILFSILVFILVPYSQIAIASKLNASCLSAQRSGVDALSGRLRRRVAAPGSRGYAPTISSATCGATEEHRETQMKL